MADRIDVELDHEPVLLVRMEGEVPDHQYQAYLARMSTALGNKRYRVAIIDARASQMNAPRHSSMQAKWLRQHKPTLDALEFATVLVIDKPVVRFALSALLALSPIPGTYKVVGTLAEAAAWTEQRLRARGHRVPALLVALAA